MNISKKIPSLLLCVLSLLLGSCCSNNCPSPTDAKCVVTAPKKKSYSSSTSYKTNSHASSGSTYASAATAPAASAPSEIIAHEEIPSSNYQNDAIAVALNDNNRHPIVVKASDSRRSFYAKGRDVIIEGSDSKVTIKDNCRKITIKGGRNIVIAESADSIDVSGSINHVTPGCSENWFGYG